MLPNREAGLPMRTDDQEGLYNRPGHLLGTVTAVDFDLWRVDVAPQEGGLLQGVQVEGDVLPEVYAPNDLASYVTYWFHDGNLQDPWCRPLHWRRFKGPEHADAPEREKYHEHLQIKRVGDLTMRISKDGKKIWLFDSEKSDWILYDQDARTVHVIAPHVFIGTDENTRIQYDRDEQVRIVIPKALIGDTAIEDQDGLTYLKNQLVHVVSTQMVQATAGVEILLEAPLIKLTADQIVLDPVNIKLGHANATERVILGDIFATLYNSLVALFNTHVHTGVQVGSGTTSIPTISASPMTDTHLSDVAHVSKSGT